MQCDPNRPPTQLPSHHQSQCPRSFSGAVSVRNQSPSEPWQSAKTHDILQASPSAFGNSALRCAPSSSATLSGLTLSSAALAQASATGCRVLSRDNSVSSKTPRNHCSRREEDVPRERAASTSVPTTRRTRRVSSLPLLSAALPPSNIKQFDKSNHPVVAVSHFLISREQQLACTYPNSSYRTGHFFPFSSLVCRKQKCSNSKTASPNVECPSRLY